MKDRIQYPFHFLCLALFLAATSCTEESEYIIPDSEPQLISNAQEYFNAEIRPTADFNKTTTTQKNRLSNFRKRNLVWSKAKVNTYGDKKVIIIPVNYDEDIFLGNESFKRSLDLHTFVKMEKIQDTKEYSVELLTFYPDEDYLQGKSIGFSGLLYKETWNGEFLKAYQTTESGYEEVEITSISESSRLSCGSDSYWQEYYWCQVTTVNGVEVGRTCTLERVVFICVEPATLAPPDFSDPGGAGGPSGGSEPPPIGCNEMEGYLVDENGDCIKETIVGDKPIAEYSNKCQGLQSIWNNYPNNEVTGYITTDGQLLVIDVLPYNGGQTWGTYEYNGITYYPYPVSQGAPATSYAGMIQSAGNYLIPVSASVHTHTPCRNDGTNGVSHPVGADDISRASQSPGINHWVIGCGAIAQYNSGSNNFFNVQTGAISTNCSNIQ